MIERQHPMFIRDKFLFFPIHKNMSTSMISFLEVQNGFTRTYKEDETKLFKFAILREPTSRFKSAYIQICRTNSSWQNKPWNQPQIIHQFIDFIRHNGFFDDHLKPQTAFLPCEMNLYLIQERIGDDIKKLKRKLKRKVKLQGKIPYSNKQDEVIELDESHINKLKQIYSLDFKLYARNCPANRKQENRKRTNRTILRATREKQRDS